MKNMQFSFEISATKEEVWNTLWRDRTFREWAGLIDPGTHMVGDLIEGNEIQFISGNGYGVTSLVEKLVPYEYLLLTHEADTQNSGTLEREKQWTGGQETYSLSEQNGKTVLGVEFDVPDELEDEFLVSYPKAFQRLKELAETN